MGTNSAVFIANLFCYTFEYDFLKRIVAAKKVNLIKKFALTRRYIDDLLSVNNDWFERYASMAYTDNEGIQGIYPDYLTLVKEQEKNSGVSFLDTEICQRGGVLYTKIYDKREHAPLNRVSQEKYPHTSTFLSKRSMFGVITSQLHRFAGICTRKADFVPRAQGFLKDFTAQGHSLSTTRAFVARFVRKGYLSFFVKSPDNFTKMLLSTCPR